jgi:hypothetical protein
MALLVPGWSRLSPYYDRSCKATGSSTEYSSSEEFQKAVYAWLDETNIKYTWAGNGESTSEFRRIYWLRVIIDDKHWATVFSLRWSQ